MGLRINANTGQLVASPDARCAAALERIADSFEEYVKLCASNKVL